MRECELVDAMAADATAFACNDLELDEVVTVKAAPTDATTLGTGGGTTRAGTPSRPGMTPTSTTVRTPCFSSTTSMAT